MKTWTKAVLGISLSFMCLFACVGYAAISGNLSILGTAEIEPPKYDDIVITSVVACSGTSATQTNSHVPLTNIKSTITGTAGQQIVYKITVHNYSKTETYVYSGAVYSPEYNSVGNKLTISTSADEANTQKIPASSGSNYYEGTPIAPDEEMVFYVTYTLNSKITAGEIMVNFSFKPVIYSVTYMNGNDIHAIDCITDNTVKYNTRAGINKPGMSWVGWVNANAIAVSSYPAGNTNSYTLSAKWDNTYLIIFADADGTVIYEEHFTSSSTKLSAEGQAIVDAKLAELNAEAATKYMTVSWSSYTIAGAKTDITVRAIYTYSGYLNLEPVYELPDDGIVDYYKILAVNALPAVVEVPGEVGGIPVKVIERVANEEGENDWNNYADDVTTIIVGEGVETLVHNSLSYTPNLTTVYLPSTIKTMEKNTFSRNDILGNDKKVLTIHFNGTMAEWKAVVANSNSSWAGGLKEGSVVNCTDGYFRYEKKNWYSSLSWVEKSY